MTGLDRLRSAFESFRRGQAGPEEQQTIHAAIASGDVQIVTGEQSAAVGGSANGAAFVTGNNNVVLLLAPDAAGIFKNALASFMTQRRVQQLLTSVYDARRRADGWKRVHEKCQTVSLKLTIVRGLVDTNNPAQTLHDLEVHWSLELSNSCRELVEMEWLPSGPVKAELLATVSRTNWFAIVGEARAGIDGFVDQCGRDTYLLSDTRYLFLLFRQMENLLAEMLRYLDYKLVSSIPELEEHTEAVGAAAFEQEFTFGD